jgi:hypothetical protein
MKIFQRLLVLAILGVPMLPGCNLSDSDDAPKPATFGTSTFDNATWD